MFGANDCQKLINSESTQPTHILSFFLASSEASELFKAANAASTPSVGDVAGVGLRGGGLGSFCGDFTGVLIVWLMVTPFLTVLIVCGVNVFFDEPHRYDILSVERGCDVEVVVDEKRAVRK